MRCEVPLFERFCFCFPLRFGLILWACIKLLISSVLLVEVTIAGVLILINDIENIQDKIPTLLMFFIVFAITGVDIILDFQFIKACRQKNGDLMKKFYYYNIFLLVISIIYIIAVFYVLPILPIVAIDTEEGFDVFNLFIVAIQLYVLLLVRSEMLKLRNDYQINQDECKHVRTDVEGSSIVNNTQKNNK